MSGRDAACTVQQLPAADGLVHTPLVQAISGMFLGDAGNADDTMANPLYADYAGFQRIYVDCELRRDAAGRFQATRQSRASGWRGRGPIDRRPHATRLPHPRGRTEEADRELARVSNWYKSNDK